MIHESRVLWNGNMFWIHSKDDIICQQDKDILVRPVVQSQVQANSGLKFDLVFSYFETLNMKTLIDPYKMAEEIF